MSGGKPPALALRILRALASLEPPGTLSGAAALPGRRLLPLEIRWRGRDHLETLPDQACRRLVEAGLEVTVLQCGSGLARFRVGEGALSSFLTLIADRSPSRAVPVRVMVGDLVCHADPPAELLVDRLCAFLVRPDLQDLTDIRELLEEGTPIERALAEAPRKDPAFSPLLLAWKLRWFQPRSLAQVSGMSEGETEALTAFNESLIRLLLRTSFPSPLAS